MTPWWLLTSMFTGGALLAALYLVGLWLTVQHLPTSPHPTVWFLASLILRTLLVLSVFYFLLGDFFTPVPGNHRWQQGLAALAGFALCRAVALAWVRRQSQETDKKGFDPR